MLYTVTQLAKYILGDIGRTLCYKIDSNTLTADKAYHLLYLVNQSLRCILKQCMSLIKEEHQTGQFQIAHLRKLCIQVR